MAEREEKHSEAETEQQETKRPSNTLAAAQSHSSEGELAQRPPGQDGRIAQRSVQDAGDVEEVRPTQRQMQSHHDRRGNPAVRLDMGLDVEIELKAKIKGYVELSVL
jgi:hypothetical protein